eukprot:3920071-Prymnesium_polylepis.2
MRAKRSAGADTQTVSVCAPCSVSTRLFKTFLCDPIAFDDAASITRRYLHDDLTLSCDDDEYNKAQDTAVAMLVLWPVGTPVLYAVLLWASYDALRQGIQTPLSRATNFLYGDYRRGSYWWECVEMCRKLALTGWVLLIGDETELARILVALLVSAGIFALHLGIKPFCRCAVRIASTPKTHTNSQTRGLRLCRAEDGAIMMVAEGALVLVYLCALLIKSCDVAPNVCPNYGFGETAIGEPWVHVHVDILSAATHN